MDHDMQYVLPDGDSGETSDPSQRWLDEAAEAVEDAVIEAIQAGAPCLPKLTVVYGCVRSLRVVSEYEPNWGGPIRYAEFHLHRTYGAPLLVTTDPDIGSDPMLAAVIDQLDNHLLVLVTPSTESTIRPCDGIAMAVVTSELDSPRRTVEVTVCAAARGGEPGRLSSTFELFKPY